MPVLSPATSLSGLLNDVVVKFRDDLTRLAERVTNSGFSPDLFRAFLSDLKSATNRAGLSAFEGVVAHLDVNAPALEFDGRRLRFRTVESKEWLTPFGLARIERRYYAGEGRGGIAPLDVQCGMQDKYMTPDVEEMSAFGASMLVPHEVEELVGKALPVAPSATAIGRVVKDVGAFFEAYHAEVERRIEQSAPLSAEGDILVHSWDGVTVPLREHGTKMGRKAERPGVRGGKEGTSPTAWKEAGVASISIYRQGAEGPEKVDTRYFARMPEPGMATLLRQQDALLERVEQERRPFVAKVVLCDGKLPIWRQVAQNPRYADWIQILDFYHAAEHLSRVAEALFGKETAAADQWFKQYRERLLLEDNGVEATLRSMRHYRKKLRRGSERDEVVRRALAHFRRNSKRMRYAEFIAKGLPIGSGPVEAACKTIVNNRLKRSGMRWSRTGGQHVLNLRVFVKSGRWQQAWQTYLGSAVSMN